MAFFPSLKHSFIAYRSFKVQIKIGQSSHNILNFQESMTILNACTKTIWKLIECTTYMYVCMYVCMFIQGYIVLFCFFFKCLFLLLKLKDCLSIKASILTLTFPHFLSHFLCNTFFVFRKFRTLFFCIFFLSR